MAMGRIREGSPLFYFMKLEHLVIPTCRLCPRECGVDRKKFKGLCKTKNELLISSYNLHFGEEPPITGKNGSGTIFFAGCNMSCVYCQNYPISQLVKAFKVITVEQLANIMLKLQTRGAHNINLVTPSHFVHLIVESIEIARNAGLSIPIIYNTSSYDKSEVIMYLDSYVDVYLADLKYADSGIAKQLSGVKDYFEIATAALKSMFRTKGKLIVKNGIAQKGLIIRHLVIPGYIENTKRVLLWIKNNLPDATISLMFQYFPVYKALNHHIINRKVSMDEYLEIKSFVESLNLNGFVQEL